MLPGFVSCLWEATRHFHATALVLLPNMLLLSTMSNKPTLGNRSSTTRRPAYSAALGAPDPAFEKLRKLLPPRWRFSADRRPLPSAPEGTLRLVAPDRTTATWCVQAKPRLDPKDARNLSQPRTDPSGTPLLVAPFLSPRTREILDRGGANYLDRTGNIRLASERPALFILSRGADVNPLPTAQGTRSLKGPKAGRIIRALCDFLPPIGVRALAARTGTDPGYCSRVLDLLDREDLIKRTKGSVIEVNWKSLIERWAQDFKPLERKRTRSYLATRGLPGVLAKLAKSRVRYAVTGAFAAAWLAPVAPPRLLICYADDPELAAATLDLRPAEAGINVLLVTPFDSTVYERTWQRDNIRCAAPSQIAVDLLNSPGRGPQEAEGLMKWMAENERAWRS